MAYCTMLKVKHRALQQQHKQKETDHIDSTIVFELFLHAMYFTQSAISILNACVYH